MCLRATFDPTWGVFKHHFAHSPTVPGVMLLDYYATHGNFGLPRNAVRLSQARFQHFIRPGAQVVYTPQHSGQVRIDCAGMLCCTFGIGWHANGEMLPLVRGEGSTRRVQIKALRESEYWFLPEEIGVDTDLRSATCQVDLDSILRTHSYLNEMPNWSLLVLVECAGNLALALQHLVEPDDSGSRYVFAQFGSIDYRMNCVSSMARQTVRTRVNRYGALLAWEASISDKESMQIVIRGAVSVKEKKQ